MNTTMFELLTPQEMAVADRLSIDHGVFSGMDLMNRAGASVVAEILSRFGNAARYVILCGPGNNGGDGYVIARLLTEAGANAAVFALAPPAGNTDASLAALACPLHAGPLDAFKPEVGDLVIDALFGAGLDRILREPVTSCLQSVRKAGLPVVAVDLPSGVSGASGKVLGEALQADLTVTFFRKKPGHLLFPGRKLCGELVVSDIGINADVLAEIRPSCFENVRDLWHHALPVHSYEMHKYSRGGVAVFSGGPTSTGAARLAAEAAARAGAGAVTVLSPPSAVLVNASHLTSIMLAPVADVEDVAGFLARRQISAVLIGPGFGTGERLRDFCELLMDGSGATDQSRPKGVVLDADAITEFSSNPDVLFARILSASIPVVLTPHQGEFARLFPDLAGNADLSKLERAGEAASRSGAIIVLKGADTVIAEPGARSAINSNATPTLATAGSGDVLAGIITGLLAQGMPAFEASCAAVWIHGEAGKLAGAGAMAEDIARMLISVMTRIIEDMA